MNKRPDDKLRCDICSTDFVTFHEKVEHEFSLMHHIRLDQGKQKRSIDHICTLCNMMMNSLTSYMNHLEGKKHKSLLSDFRKSVKEAAEKEKENKIIKKNSSKQSLKVSKSAGKNAKQKIKKGNDIDNPKTKFSSKPEKYKTDYPSSCNQQEYNRTQDWNYYNNNYNFMSKGNFHSPNKQEEKFSEPYTETDYWNYQHWNTRYCYQQWNGSSLDRSHEQYPLSNEYYYSDDNNLNSNNDNSNKDCEDKSFKHYPSITEYYNYSENNLNSSNESNLNKNISESGNFSDNHENYNNQQEIKCGKWKSKSLQNKYNSSSNKYKYVNPAIKFNKSTSLGKKIKQHNETENKEIKLSGKMRAKGMFPKQTLVNTNSKKKLYSKFSNIPNSCSNKNVHNSNEKIKDSKKESLYSTHVNDCDDIPNNKLTIHNDSKNISINKLDKENEKKINDEISVENKEDKSKSDENLTKQNNIVEKKKKVDIPLLYNNKNDDDDKSNSTEQKSIDAVKNVEQESARYNTKLYKLSQLIEKSEIEIGAYNKELINRLVNFPRSRKEQIRLEQWIKQHIKSKKRLTLPRFNLQLGPSEISKEENKNSPSILYSMVSEVVNSLPENLLNSVVSALKNGENDNLEQHLQNNKLRNDFHQPSILKSKVSSDSSNNSELTYDDKLQWLENWITYNLPTAEESTIAKVEVLQSNENDSDESNDSSKECNHLGKIDQVLDPCIIKVKEEQKSDDDSVSTDNFEKTIQNNSEGTNVISDHDTCLSRKYQSEINFPSEIDLELSSKIPDKTSSALNSDENVDLVNDIRIKIEPIDLEEEEEYSNSNEINESVNTVDNNADLSGSFISFPQSKEININNDTSINYHLPNVTEINNIEEILNRNELLQSQASTRLNSPNVSQSSPLLTSGSSSSSQTLIQNVLAISQKEEEIRILGQNIDQNIIYLMKLIEEQRKKRTQLYQEEVQLRSQRIQLLQTLQEMQCNPNGINTENGSVHSENKNSFVNETIIQAHQNFGNESNVTVSSNNNQLESSTLDCSNSSVQSLSSKAGKQRTEKLVNNNKIKKDSNDKISINKIKIEKSRKRTFNTENSSSDKNIKHLENSKNKKREIISAKKLKLNENSFSNEITENLEKVPIENQHANPIINNTRNLHNLSVEKENNEKKDNSLLYETTNEKCGKNLENAENSHSSSSNIQLCENIFDSLCENKAVSLSHQKETIEINKFEAHKSPVVNIKIYDGYLYTCSSDKTAKKFDLKNLTNVMTFTGHEKIVIAVHVAKSAEGQKEVFTSSMDGYLRCFDDQIGQCFQAIDLNSPILCMTEGWGKLYLGLYSGKVIVLNLTNKKVVDSIQCSKCAISCIAVAAEGAQRILCVASYDTALTVWDAQSGLLLRCLEGRIKPPCSIQISGNVVYTSTTESTGLIHNLSSGKLQKVLNWPSSATGLYILPKFILSCSFDGLVRCYTKEGWMLHAMYYGAGKSSVLCMDVHKDLVFTGNRKGIIDAFKFDPDCVVPCQFGKCYFRFGRLEDLEYHIKHDHFLNINNKLKTCVWRGCSEQFLSQSDQEKRNHILQHGRNNYSSIEDSCI